MPRRATGHAWEMDVEGAEWADRRMQMVFMFGLAGGDVTKEAVILLLSSRTRLDAGVVRTRRQ